MKSFQEIFFSQNATSNPLLVKKNICFSKEIYNELNSKISQNTTKEEFVEIVRSIDNCFHGCYDCGNNLEEYENGFLTSHGFCDECLTKEEQE